MKLTPRGRKRLTEQLLEVLSYQLVEDSRLREDAVINGRPALSTMSDELLLDEAALQDVRTYTEDFEGSPLAMPVRMHEGYLVDARGYAPEDTAQVEYMIRAVNAYEALKAMLDMHVIEDVPAGKSACIDAARAAIK